MSAAQCRVVDDLLEDLETEYDDCLDGTSAVVAPVRARELGLSESFMYQARHLTSTPDIDTPGLGERARSSYLTVLEMAESSLDENMSDNADAH